MNYEPGNIVFLKSGSPAMTVIIGDDEFTECNWFQAFELCVSIFPTPALTDDFSQTVWGAAQLHSAQNKQPLNS